MTPSGARPPRPYAEFSVDFVLGRCAPVGTGTRERLDALEGTLRELVRRWHPAGPLSPARDVRVAPGTLDALMAWVEEGAMDASMLARLGTYHSGAVADAAVPRGWIRVYLGSEVPAPDSLTAVRR